MNVATYLVIFLSVFIYVQGSTSYFVGNENVINGYQKDEQYNLVEKVGSINGIAATSSYVYWTDNVQGIVRRSNLKFGDIKTIYKCALRVSCELGPIAARGTTAVFTVGEGLFVFREKASEVTPLEGFNTGRLFTVYDIAFLGESRIFLTSNTPNYALTTITLDSVDNFKVVYTDTQFYGIAIQEQEFKILFSSDNDIESGLISGTIVMSDDGKAAQILDTTTKRLEFSTYIAWSITSGVVYVAQKNSVLTSNGDNDFTDIDRVPGPMAISDGVSVATRAPTTISRVPAVAVAPVFEVGVPSATAVCKTTGISDAECVNGKVRVDKDVVIDDDTEINTDIEINGNFTITNSNTKLVIKDGGTLNISGCADFSGTLVIDGDDFSEREIATFDCRGNSTFDVIEVANEDSCKEVTARQSYSETKLTATFIVRNVCGDGTLATWQLVVMIIAVTVVIAGVIGVAVFIYMKKQTAKSEFMHQVEEPIQTAQKQ